MAELRYTQMETKNALDASAITEPRPHANQTNQPAPAPHGTNPSPENMPEAPAPAVKEKFKNVMQELLAKEEAGRTALDASAITEPRPKERCLRKRRLRRRLKRLRRRLKRLKR